jgi:hypothetical protein
MKCYFVVVVIAAMMAASTVQAVLECRNSANGVDRCGDGVKACMVKTFYKEITFKTDIASVWGCGESDHDSCEKNTVSGTRYTVHGTRYTENTCYCYGDKCNDVDKCECDTTRSANKADNVMAAAESSGVQFFKTAVTVASAAAVAWWLL